MSKPVVAIVGRPNVGKSTLFNKLAGSRVSIVEDIPGVTRDRIYFEVEWNGRAILLVDTGGIEPRSDDPILGQMKTQAEVAVETADVIVFMVDVNVGLTAADRDIATMLKKSGKPVIPVVNKVDSIGELPMEYYEFYELGFDEDPIPLSSLHGTGSGDLLDRVLEICPADEEKEDDSDIIKVAVIGKPNAGKSSIINKILGEDRLIVSNVPGTTRDAVDTRLDNEYGKFVFIDTAGIRRQSKVEDRIEKFSVLRAKMAVERADVCIIMIDANEGVTEQDEKIAGIAHEAGKASIICINKWDTVETEDKNTVEYDKKVYTALSYMMYAPTLYVSAKTGQRVTKLFEMITYVHNQNCMRVTTGMLNDVLNDAITRVQPPSDKGRRLKIYYMTEIGTKPPTFVIFCNDAELFHFSYQRYIENQLREVFGFRGTPVKIIVRQKGDGED
ncbi:MAG: ribosome biogenesis GTPase Der [Candidatus Flemingibacterium sp.]|nr:ribosome biogenesis GTPase Der [Candidatus Flemingibacterium sp.]